MPKSGPPAVGFSIRSGCSPDVRKKTQWIGFHDDTDEKARVRDILYFFFGLHAIQDEVLFFDKQSGHLVAFTEGLYSKEQILDKYHVHYPDLLVRSSRPFTVVEIDGEVHWTNSNARKRTNRRNLHYEAAGLRFLWLTAGEVNGQNTTEKINETVKIFSERLKILPDLREGWKKIQDLDR